MMRFVLWIVALAVAVGISFLTTPVISAAVFVLLILALSPFMLSSKISREEEKEVE